MTNPTQLTLGNISIIHFMSGLLSESILYDTNYIEQTLFTNDDEDRTKLTELIVSITTGKTKLLEDTHYAYINNEVFIGAATVLSVLRIGSTAHTKMMIAFHEPMSNVAANMISNLDKHMLATLQAYQVSVIENVGSLVNHHNSAFDQVFTHLGYGEAPNPDTMKDVKVSNV